MDICRKDRRGKHKPRAFADIGNPNKIIKVTCDNCGQILSSEGQQQDEQKAF